jgi:hypothetical protein
VILSHARISRAIRQLAALILLVFSSITLPVGCGEPAVQESSMPPREFGEKLAKEHPELFIKKIGKNKTEVLDGRDKRAIIRQEWEKSQQQ